MGTSTLVLIDIQKEYNTEGRSFYINGIGKSLENAEQMLAHARHHQWNVLHVKHYGEDAVFIKGSKYSDYIEGFEPVAGEKEFLKHNFSCFSDEKFCEELATVADSDVYIVGYNSTMCVLSTIIDGYHRGYQMTLVCDATDAKSLPGKSETEVHEMMVAVLGSFSAVVSTVDVVGSD